MTMRIGLILVVAACAGCGQPTPQPPAARTPQGGVAIIDLDAVAARLGNDQQMLASISSKQAELNQHLAQTAQAYRKQLEAQRQPPAPGGESEGVTLAAFEQAAQSRLDEARRQAETTMAAHQAELVRQFRNHVRPAARRVARERGLSIIITRNDSVVYDYVDAVDITDAVVAELQCAECKVPSHPR